MSTQGIRQLPVGMSLNVTALPELTTLDMDGETVLHIKHSQGWNVYFYKLQVDGDFDLQAGNISLGAGGHQGGRVWTKTHDLNEAATTNLPIMGGSFYFDNIFAALDGPGEWYFNSKTDVLYYWPNNTDVGQPPPKDVDLVIGNLSNLITLESDDHTEPLFNVAIEDINFRDTRYTVYLPSWSLFMK